MLFDTIQKDRTAARLAGNKVVSSVLTVLVSELQNQAKRINTEVNDEMVVKTCKSMIDNNNITLLKLKSSTADRSPELVPSLISENVALSVYLPVQLTEQDMRAIITELNAANLGEIMKHFKTKFAGQYDGGVLSAIAKEFV